MRGWASGPDNKLEHLNECQKITLFPYKKTMPLKYDFYTNRGLTAPSWKLSSQTDIKHTKEPDLSFI